MKRRELYIMGPGLTQAERAAVNKLKRAAFSLVELMMVLVIMAMFAALAAPRYANSLSRYRAEAAARRIAADLAMVQARARAAGATRVINFDRTASSYLVAGESDLNKPGKPYLVDLSSDPYYSSIATVSFGGNGTIAFNGFGVPSSGGMVRVRSGIQTCSVTVDDTSGVVTVQ
jgi:prepilin-type N-terminal cleavage/methylation domain-containing protein